MGPRDYLQKSLHLRKKRISIIGALNDGKVGAPCAFEGYCNSELFEAYVEKILVPTLKPGQTRPAAKRVKRG